MQRCSQVYPPAYSHADCQHDMPCDWLLAAQQQHSPSLAAAVNHIQRSLGAAHAMQCTQQLHEKAVKYSHKPYAYTYKHQAVSQALNSLIKSRIPHGHPAGSQPAWLPRVVSSLPHASTAPTGCWRQPAARWMSTLFTCCSRRSQTCSHAAGTCLSACPRQWCCPRRRAPQSTFRSQDPRGTHWASGQSRS